MTTHPTETSLDSNVQNTDEIEADNDHFSDLASSIGDGSDFCSLTDSVRRHVYENGRRYHSKWEGRYVLPNDETEQNRLDMFHEIRKRLLGDKLHIATLPDQVHNVLDCGTGTGIWAIEFAEEHPEAQVFGVDLTAIQPDWVPPNCFFEVDDLEQPWLWKEKFDYIHSADLAQSIRDWNKYVQRVFKNLTPGGVAEFQEVYPGWMSDDDSLPKGGYIEKYMDAWNKACAKAGLKNVAPTISQLLDDAGFVDIKVIYKKMPIGYWPKNPGLKVIGGYGIAQNAEAVNSYGLALFTRELGMTKEESEELASNAFKECMQRGVHSYILLIYVTGRKPE